MSPFAFSPLIVITTSNTNQMKKILFIALALSSISITSKAQITKGSILIGGDLSLNSSKSVSRSPSNTFTSKTKGIYISPVFGMAFKENLIFGGSLTFGTSKTEYNGSSNEGESDYFGAGLFLRKYKNIGNKGFYFFLQSDLKWFNSEQEVKSPGFYIENSKHNEYSLSLYPGLSYAVSRKFHIEAGLANLLSISYYSKDGFRQNSNVTETDSEKGFGLSSSLDNGSVINIGIRFILSK